MSLWIGLDIGGTRIKGGVLDSRGRTICQAVEPTRAGQSLSEFDRQLAALVTKLQKAAPEAPVGIGASITGPVDPKVGCVFLPGKIRGLDRHKTVPFLQKKFGLPVIADNDGRLACYAEWKLGAGKGVDNLIVITLGTGIGSGVVMDGSILTDRHFLRGTQCGHMVIDTNGPRCLTGSNGTGESLASVTALVQQVRDHLSRGLPLRIKEPAMFPQIAAAVRAGDPLTTEIFERWLDRFASVLLNSYYAYTPDLILLAGGPTKAASLFLKKLEDRLNKAAFRLPGTSIPIKVARLGENAGWIGGALLAHDHFERES